MTKNKRLRDRKEEDIKKLFRWLNMFVFGILILLLIGMSFQRTLGDYIMLVAGFIIFGLLIFILNLEEGQVYILKELSNIKKELKKKK